MAKRHWKKVHKSSGATVIERHSKGCKLTVIPSDWSRPRGAAVWSATCGNLSTTGKHKRGNSSTVKNAKAAAARAVKAMRR